jgi:hypothetical protein
MNHEPMDIKELDELIRILAGYFTGPDMPLNNTALHIGKGGKFQLRERAERFFKVREQLGINGWPNAEQAETALRRKLGIPPRH